jgi:hypothetical protein
MKLSITNSERLEIRSNSALPFGFIRQFFSRKICSQPRRVRNFNFLPFIPALICLLEKISEKISLRFFKKEVLKWEQEKIEWMMENDDVSKLI